MEELHQPLIHFRQHFIRACDRLNLVLVAPDYRLAPQISVPDVLEDVADSVAFTLSSSFSERVQKEVRGSDDRHSGEIDNSEYILAGSSAGGWAALLLGLQLTPTEPKLPTPLAVISIYPITTLSSARAPYFYKPLKPLPFAPSPQAKVGDSVPLTDELRAHMDPNGPVLSEAPINVLTSRAPLYVYARQEGLYPHLVLGESTRADTCCVPSLLYRRFSSVEQDTVAASSPRFVFLATGDADVHVEMDQTEQALKALQEIHAPFDVFSHIIPGKGHLFDIHDTQADIPEIWSKVQSIT
jgi:acetyl esterase/lipase